MRIRVKWNGIDVVRLEMYFQTTLQLSETTWQAAYQWALEQIFIS